ncbi:UNVERIFIED_CONTAM: hypothetical protein HDU68_006339, partial [Siphonaria sp. JEL0065]
QNIIKSWPHEKYSPPHAPSEASISLLSYPDHADGSETQTSRTETFFQSWFLKAGVLLGASVFAIQTLQKKGGGENPFTKYIGDNLKGREAVERDMAESFKVQQKLADDARILNGQSDGQIHRLYFPGVFERRSDFLVEPGSQSTFTDSDVKVKTFQQKDDDLFGAPYANKE